MLEIHLNYKDGKPLYEQLFDQIAAQILRGELAADFCLPSIRFIAKELNISVITAKNAYDLLESQGFIYTRAGKGCFVAARDVSKCGTAEVASEKLKNELLYYKNLGLSKDELLALVDTVYDEELYE